MNNQLDSGDNLWIKLLIKLLN